MVCVLSNLTDQCPINKFNLEVGILRFVFPIGSLITNLLLFDDGINVTSTEPLTSDGGISVLVHPIRNSLKIPTLLTQVGCGVVEELLVVTVIVSTP